MHRVVAATYRTDATIDLVRSEMAISSGNIRVVPDRDDLVGTGGRREGNGDFGQPHDLHLPDDNLRTYQHSDRRGDYAFSAEVDEDRVGRVKGIMSGPEEAHHLDRRPEEFRTSPVDPYSDPNNRILIEERMARRDPDHADPYTRDEPLAPRKL